MRECKNMKSKPGLEIGLRPELGSYELCDKHYDAGKTECEEHCAVCKLKAQVEALEAQVADLLDLARSVIASSEPLSDSGGMMMVPKSTIMKLIEALSTLPSTNSGEIRSTGE